MSNIYSPITIIDNSQLTFSETSFVFYVYAYIRKNGTPYYIGKGKGSRLYNNKAHYVKIPKDRSRIIFLERNLSEIGALALERRYIRWYGRKDLGTGILRNLTDGGEGTSGFIHSHETRKKISVGNKGKIQTPEARAKMSAAKKGNSRRPRSIEFRTKMSLLLTGRKLKPFSAEHCANISAAKKGKSRKPLSHEHKLKISESRKGKTKNISSPTITANNTYSKIIS